MANELRVRTGFLGGLIEDNPLTSGATTVTSAALATMPVIGSTQHMAVVLDPDGMAGAPEVVYVTAHSAAATTATIARGQEGTTARQHDRDILWVHSVTVKDYDGAAGGSGLIGRTVYYPAGDLSYSLTSTSATLADVDATNLVVAFTAPPSGSVLVSAEFLRTSPAGNQSYFGLRDVSGLVAGTVQYSGHAPTANDDLHRVRHTWPITGLTPGTAYSYKLASKVSGGTGTLYYGLGAGTFGPIIMEVWAVNL
jgi:hypothetical protein